METQTLPLVRLKRSLSFLETWGFGLSGLLLWLGPAPAMNAALGVQAIFVWIPAAIIGILLNFQVQHLGRRWTDMSGGTPNYAARLLAKYPIAARYGAIGYWLGWVSVPPMNALILSDLVIANLNPVGLDLPENLLRLGFTVIPYIVAFSGTRTLGILHLCFIIPALGFLVTFGLQGLGWLTFAPVSPGILPTDWGQFNLVEWAKWFFVAVYAAYGCETASSFVADSRQPRSTLKTLSFAAVLLPIVYVGGSWILMRLAGDPSLENNTFLHLVAGAQPFWGSAASTVVTFLLSAGCLLSSTTAISNSPRVLYQLAVDGYIAPVFGVVSSRGVFGPGLLFTFILSLICLLGGDVAHVVMVTGTGYLSSMMAVHLSLWLNRDRPEVKWPRWSLLFLIVESFVMVVGGLAWGWHHWLMGLLLPLTILGVDGLIRRRSVRLFRVEWWLALYRPRRSGQFQNFDVLQVGVLLFLICGALTVGWVVRTAIDQSGLAVASELYVLLLLSIALVGVAIACWTSLPQIASIVEAQEATEHLFKVALDPIMVIDKHGAIARANPAACELFGVSAQALVGVKMAQLLPGLRDAPQFWHPRCEQVVNPRALSFPEAQSSAESFAQKTVEVSLSSRTNWDQIEYVVILRDITPRKQAEAELKAAFARQEELTATATRQAHQLETALSELKHTQSQLIQTEKMSSLGQLVAGVAHEINNPVNFIYGNLTYINEYATDLLALIRLYQDYYPEQNPEIEAFIEEMDLNFLAEDLPKMIASMKIGAERIRQIVLTLRNFSRMDEADMKKVNIHEGIESTLLILQNRLKGKAQYPRIQIIEQYSDLPEVECFASQLNQVFMNIISNAIDALHERAQAAILTPDQGDVQPPRIKIHTAALDSHWVRITIADNGPGIPENIQHRLFDPFFTTKAVGEGTGLGLSICYQIVVEKHGGRLYCTSDPGEGAQFIIEIPVKTVRKAAQPEVISAID
ncbi:amino acid permease [Laspinema olomoucense]|uniref:histidine kinase n=1 Tax=Laspinema olomoucense D3b TaxID=2953688 RepID=A0ABT2N5K6_9CYAN|nr:MULTISPECIES: amino acid permease [unclassified Laspinema]MCT7976566.1 ATP-binding protein [Laspinema sp. D3b]MCT7994994.1 ATP-binding protein [Laspinema sp. D3c]